MPLLFSYINALMWAFVAAYAMLITTLIVAVLSENRNPLKALGWVMACCCFRWEGQCFILYSGAACVMSR